MHPAVRPRFDADRLPREFAVALGAVAVVAAGFFAVLIPASDAGWRFGVIAVTVGLFAAVTLDQLALAAVTILGFLVFNGFLTDQFGQLAWHGSVDLWRLSLLVVAAAWGLAVGEAYRWIASKRATRMPERDA
jgi:hypothetical protein